MDMDMDMEMLLSELLQRLGAVIGVAGARCSTRSTACAVCVRARVITTTCTGPRLARPPSAGAAGPMVRAVGAQLSRRVLQLGSLFGVDRHRLCADGGNLLRRGARLRLGAEQGDRRDDREPDEDRPDRERDPVATHE